MSTIAVIIVAGGTGNRFGGDVPKQYATVHGKSVLAHTLKPFFSHPRINWVQCVIHADAVADYTHAIEGLTILPPVIGGATRQASVRAGLKALMPYKPDIVFIHDAARPNITAEDIDALLAEFDAGEKAAILALPLYDTVKRVEGGFIVETLPREVLYRAQTPQVFMFNDILSAHLKANHDNFTDDAAVAEAASMRVKIVPGNARNIKITTQNDLLHVVNQYEES